MATASGYANNPTKEPSQPSPVGTVKPQLPPPLVTFRHPVKWVWNKTQTLISALFAAHVGTLAIVAVYYLLFEINPSMNHWWHSTVSNSTLRHDIRGVAEGLLGGFLAQQVIWNHYKKKNLKPPRLLDKVEMALHIPNVHRPAKKLRVSGLFISPLLAMVYAIPGFVAGYFIVKGFHNADQHVHAAIAATFHPTNKALWAKTKTIYTSQWPQKAIGFGASFFFGRRPMKGTFDNVQTWFAERRVIRGKKPPRIYPVPTFKARYNDLDSQGALASAGAGHQGILNTVMLLGLTVTVGLAVYGWYILAYRAP